jgi:hypothetical protein
MSEICNSSCKSWWLWQATITTQDVFTRAKVRRDAGQRHAGEDQELVGVKDGIAVSDEDDELVAVFLLQLAAPTLRTLTVEQVMGKGQVGGICSRCTWCRRLVATR